jgi:hypothetical protein
MRSEFTRRTAGTAEYAHLERDLEIQPPRTAFFGVGANGLLKALMAILERSISTAMANTSPSSSKAVNIV